MSDDQKPSGDQAGQDGEADPLLGQLGQQQEQ